MPSFPPRSEAIRKQEQLNSRENELRHAIQKDYPLEKILVAVKKYRLAQLSLLKAQLHAMKDKEFQRKPHSLKEEKIRSLVDAWTKKTDEEILATFK